MQFLRSIASSHSNLARARGVAVGVEPLGRLSLVRVDWGDPEIPEKVLSSNLALVGPNRKFCNVD